jgi:hypothetical protein
MTRDASERDGDRGKGWGVGERDGDVGERDGDVGEMLTSHGTMRKLEEGLSYVNG